MYDDTFIQFFKILPFSMEEDNIWLNLFIKISAYTYQVICSKMRKFLMDASGLVWVDYILSSMVTYHQVCPHGTFFLFC